MFRDTYAEVNLHHIHQNIVTIRQHLPHAVKLMAVIKANGYGHGDIQAAQIAEQAGADMLAVAFLEEALHLRDCGVQLPILIFTPVHPQEVPLAIAKDLMLTVHSAAWFQEMRAYKSPNSLEPLKVHVKMNTGLGRLGINDIQEWEELAPWLTAEDIKVEGVYTHFATAGHADSTYLMQQYERFLEMKEWTKAAGIPVHHFHCAGSAAAIRFPELTMDMVRIGAALFGFNPAKAASDLQLEPVLSLHSSIIQVRKVRKGDYIGYDNRYQAKQDEWIGTIPLGYADGWSQRMQGTSVLVNGTRAHIVGKICMDHLMVRLTAPCSPGAPVTLIGSQGDDAITCAELAAHIDSVPQEITTSLTTRITKIYKGEAGEEWNSWEQRKDSKIAYIN
ncbi:alanine racemase [Paenibacillaceae bacterium]|nr:alanine racemase [Paenibacillaceae bacterium]